MAIFRAVVSILAIIASLTAATAAPPNLTVETQDGSFEGVANGNIISFKGIPYAAPPVGDLRWRAPQPIQKWSGTKRADAFGNACIPKPGLSDENGGNPGTINEDCLYLNVWTPALRPNAKLPVIVWIHGGAYVFGSGSVPLYDGTPMAKKDVVYVSINYRLGSLGFFAHPSLEKEKGETAYNFGLLDQVAALKWVKANIEKFGGDPGNVTIMGQSAGAKSVVGHFASPLSRGLFHKGIALSTYILPEVKLDKARQVAASVATEVGLNGAEASLEDLRKVPAERFGEITAKEALLGPVGIVGDAMLPNSIAYAFDRREEAPVPLIIGNTSDDASVIAAFGISPEEIVKKLGVAGIGLKLLYPDTAASEMPRQALRDIVFTLNPRWVADRHARLANTWRYYFDYSGAKDRAKSANGVPHGAEIAYFLDTLGPGSSSSDHEYAGNVSAYVVSFARSGHPASPAKVEWEKHQRWRDFTLIFGQEKIELRRSFMKSRLGVLMAVTTIVDSLFGKQQ